MEDKGDEMEEGEEMYMDFLAAEGTNLAKPAWKPDNFLAPENSLYKQGEKKKKRENHDEGDVEMNSDTTRKSKLLILLRWVRWLDDFIALPRSWFFLVPSEIKFPELEFIDDRHVSGKRRVKKDVRVGSVLVGCGLELIKISNLPRLHRKDIHMYRASMKEELIREWLLQFGVSDIEESIVSLFAFANCSIVRSFFFSE